MQDFTEPATVVCILCRATISVDKGDRTRFLNHILHDHEVHFDRELLFALSYMNEVEKGSIVGIMKDKFPSETEERTVEIEKAAAQQPENGRIEIVAATEVESCTASEDQMEVVPDIESMTESVTKNAEESSKIDMVTIKKESTEFKAIAEKFTDCKICSKKILKNSINLHMRLKHNTRYTKGKFNSVKVTAAASVTAKYEPRDTKQKIACTECSKYISKGNMNRHMKMLHKSVQNSWGKFVHKVLSKEPKKREKLIKSLEGKSIVSENLVPETIVPEKNPPEEVTIDDSESSASNVYCKECSMEFGTPNILKKHVIKIHGIGNEKCDQCSKRLQSKKALIYHLEHVHKK